MNQYTVSNIMRPPVMISDNETLEGVLQKMISEKRNSLTVVNEEGVFVGAVNALDVIRAVLPDYLEEDTIASRFADESILREDAKKVRSLQVKDFMSTEVPTIHEHASIVEAAVLAAVGGRGRITVLDEKKRPIGILTRTEIKRIIGSYLDITESE